MVRRLLLPLHPGALSALLVMTMLAFACSSREAGPAPAQAAAPSRTIVVDPASSPITAAAEREILRREEAMRRADEAALRASRQMADGDYEAALSSSRDALGGR